MNPAPPSDILWQSPEALRLSSNLLRYQTWLAEHHGKTFPTYDDLYHWSITEIGAFWRSIADFFEVKFHTEPSDPPNRRWPLRCEMVSWSDAQLCRTPGRRT